MEQTLNVTSPSTPNALPEWTFLDAQQVVCVVNFMFILVMYALWISLGRHHAASKDVGQFKDAMTTVTQAQAQYGANVGEWSSKTLQRKVVNGRRGMGFADEGNLRNRAAGSGRDEELGDPWVGDWEGDVLFEDKQKYGVHDVSS